MYGGAAVLDSRSDVVGGMAYDTAVEYADQLLFPDPAQRDGRAVGGRHGPLHLPRPLGRRAAAGGLAAAGAGARARRRRGDGLRDQDRRRVRVLPAQRRPRPLFGGWHIFNHTRLHAHPVVRELLDTLPGVGVDFITANAEYGPGQFEFDWGPGLGIAGPGRRATRSRTRSRRSRARHGLIGTFMSKPINGAAGCGAHFHVSLLDATAAPR